MFFVVFFSDVSRIKKKQRYPSPELFPELGFGGDCNCLGSQVGSGEMGLFLSFDLVWWGMKLGDKEKRADHQHRPIL